MHNWVKSWIEDPVHQIMSWEGWRRTMERGREDCMTSSEKAMREVSV